MTTMLFNVGKRRAVNLRSVRASSDVLNSVNVILMFSLLS
jgi:hypothetical protein